MSGKTNRVSVTIIVPVKNEAHNLPRCLKSVASWADEVIVVDSYSTDGTPEIAESFGARVVQFDFNGTWPKKKNWTLENIQFRNQWVLILDADEVLPPEAEDEVREAVTAGARDDIDGYWINRRFYFMGKWLKHAYYPNWNLRLFRHEKGRYEKITDIDTASGDNEVHEHVVVQGKTARLKSELAHYAFPNIETFVEKHNRYSNWEARVWSAPQASPRADQLQALAVAWSRRLRLLSHFLPFRPLLRFLYVYVWQRGFLDGLEGYYFARLHGFYEFLIVAKSYECKKNSAKMR